MRTGVLILTPYYYPIIGGVESNAERLARYLVSQQVPVQVLTKRIGQGLPDDENRDGVAIHRIGPDRKLVTLVESPRIRWPDGMSFGPDGWLYFTCSSLQDVIFQPASHVQASAPYQIFRFRPGATSVPGQ